VYYAAGAGFEFGSASRFLSVTAY